MKKKILRSLFLSVALHLPYAASAGNTPSTPIDTEVGQPDASANNAAAAPIDTEVDQPDTYLPVVQNYFSFIYEPLKMDYLYDSNSKNSPKFPSTKKIDWAALFPNNGAFLYDIRLNQSRFALCVGVGWSNLYYSFVGKKGGEGTIYEELKRVSESDVSFEDIDNTTGKQVYRSTLNIPFFDFLVRIRFNSVLEAPKEGFHSWFGFKLGLRKLAAMKYYYKEYNDSGASLVTNGSFNLKPFACVFQTGMGYHRFGFTGGIHLTPLFEKNKGPDGSDSNRPFSFGIYVDLM